MFVTLLNFLITNIMCYRAQICNRHVHCSAVVYCLGHLFIIGAHVSLDVRKQTFSWKKQTVPRKQSKLILLVTCQANKAQQISPINQEASFASKE